MQDDSVVADLVVSYLQRDGIVAAIAADGETGLRLVRSLTPDLVVADVATLGVDRFSFCEQVRRHVQAPIILLTPTADESGLDEVGFGVADYLVTPVRPRELMQRIRGIIGLRRGRSPHPQPTELIVGDLVLDQRSRQVNRGGSVLVLSDREFDLLAHLMRHPGRVFRRDELVREVWDDCIEAPSSIAAHIHRLREKIEDDPAHPTMLVTVWGAGYRFDAPDTTQP
ncbi:response regulator transcription factor [Saccharopolyspora thermophila]|uniref:response regulator transcription factor n=1 Tax=Saccharopolyspora thermophila TaxID=89367 RepID=UPI00166C873A|nr:response regulator transcription factor [Saccharopolyspora subtropica]